MFGRITFSHIPDRTCSFSKRPLLWSLSATAHKNWMAWLTIYINKKEILDYQLNTLPRRPPPPQTHLFPLKNNRLYTGILMQNIVEWSYFPYNHTNIPEFGQQGHVLTWSNLTARVVVDKRFHTAVTNLSMKGSNSSLYLEAYRVISSQTWLLTCIKWGRVRIIYSKGNI